ADGVVDQAALSLVLPVVAQRLARPRFEGAADDPGDELGGRPWGQVGEPAGDLERHLDAVIAIQRPASVLDALQHVGGERGTGNERGGEVRLSVEPYLPASRDDVRIGPHHQVVAARVSVDDARRGPQLLERRVRSAEQLRVLAAQPPWNQLAGPIDAGDGAEHLVDDLDAAEHPVAHVDARGPGERAPDGPAAY